MKCIPRMFLLGLLLAAAATLSPAAFAKKPAREKYSPEAEAMLRNAKSVVLYSLDPSMEATQSRWGEKFEQYKVLGKVRLKDKQAADAAQAFLVAVGSPPEPPLACFDPRHGLRVKSGGHEYDFLLCYECMRVDVYRDGNVIEQHGAAGMPDALNAILKAARVRLPPPPK